MLNTIRRLPFMAVVWLVLTTSAWAQNSHCETVWNHFVGSSEPSCCNATFQGLNVTCNAENEITALRYNAINTNVECDNTTVSVLSPLTTLEHLQLNYYVNETACPTFFTLFGNLTRLTSLEIRGTHFTGSNRTARTNSRSVESLDVSYSNTIPLWINTLFPNVKGLVLLGNSWYDSYSTLACATLTNLSIALSNVTWLSSCTKLTQLDIRLDRPQVDVSEWLAPVIPSLTLLNNLTVIVEAPQQRATFPTWLDHLTHLTALVYRANIVDQMHSEVLKSLPLTTLDMSGNDLYGDFPDALSSTQLVTVDLRENELSGKIPAALAEAESCDLSGNPILCAGIGNTWNVCQHCNLVPSFSDIMRRYMIQWIVVAVCLFVIVCVWIYVAVKKHQQTSFRGWLNVFYSVFSAVNLFTTIAVLGMRVTLYTTTFSLLTVTTVIYILVNTYLYRYCCRRFGILVIRRTWPVFILCTLDLNNFGLYEIRMLNLSAYRMPIDHRVPRVLSWVKVLIADVPHTAIAIFLLMLHAPVASVLLLCITSGVGIVRAIVQVLHFWCQTRRNRKFHPMSQTQPENPQPKREANNMPSSSNDPVELAQLIK
ncbi:hypothetical protein BJV82DRAFT_616343 [Fennellomyces sp. T-0311]|nr:hypothetical protein BJV82DRAFT_616343 [Fennellomyces sp. T-0311]